jgi:hypothetical protein
MKASVLARIPHERVVELEHTIDAWAEAVTDDPDDFFSSSWNPGHTKQSCLM